MRNKIVVFLSFVITVLFFTYKPLYSILLFTIFSYEHFLFLNLVISFLKAKKSDSYACFSVSPLKTTHISTYEIWLKINEISAYRRLYLLTIAKKFNLRSILFTIIVIFFGLPVRLFRIIKFLIQCNAHLHESLAYLYSLDYGAIKDKKIEVIFKKTYLNASIRDDIIKKLIKLNPHKLEEEICQIYLALVNANHDFMNDENKTNTDKVVFQLGWLETEESFKIKTPHWANESNWKINGEKILCATHATSNLPKVITNTQFKSTAMQEFVLANSPNPASIITHGNYVFRAMNDRQQLIKSWQLRYTIYDIYKKNLDSPYLNKFIERDYRIIEILGPKASYNDISEFSACTHNLVLENDYGKSFQELLHEIRNAAN